MPHTTKNRTRPARRIVSVRCWHQASISLSKFKGISYLQRPQQLADVLDPSES